MSGHRSSASEASDGHRASLPPLKKRTRHWCSHGLEGSMVTARLIDWSINRYFSERKKQTQKGNVTSISNHAVTLEVLNNLEYETGFYLYEKDRQTFPEVDLEGQEVSLDLVAHEVLQRDQELHCLLQRIRCLVKISTNTVHASHTRTHTLGNTFLSATFQREKSHPSLIIRPVRVR